MISSHLCIVSALCYMKVPVWTSIGLMHHAPLCSINTSIGPTGPIMQSFAGIVLRYNRLIVSWLLEYNGAKQLFPIPFHILILQQTAWEGVTLNKSPSFEYIYFSWEETNLRGR